MTRLAESSSQDDTTNFKKQFNPDVIKAEDPIDTHHISHGESEVFEAGMPAIS